MRRGGRRAGRGVQTLTLRGEIRQAKQGGAWMGEKSEDRTTGQRTSPCLPGMPPNSRNPQIPKIPKAKLRAGLQKFGNGLPGFLASSLDCWTLKTQSRTSSGHRSAWRPFTSPRIFIPKSLQPQPLEHPKRPRCWGGSRLGSCSVSVPPSSRSYPQKKKTWALRESCGMFFVIDCILASTARPGAKSWVSGVGEDCALVSGDVRRTRGGVRG